VIGVAIRSRADLSLRILRHLLAQGGLAGAYGKDDLAPLSLIQKEIAKGLGLPHDHFNVVLKRLVVKGLASVSTRLVRGTPRRLRVYFLTRAGAETVHDR
jgi:DNA-binding MarR family transcriptional regulator